MLTTGRLYAHWHTLTRTAKVDKLVRREPGPFVEIHPDDAQTLDIVVTEDLDLVELPGAPDSPDGLLNPTG